MTLVLPDIAYDCLCCGKSCSIFEVEIMPDEHERLRKSPVTHELERKGFHPLKVRPSGRVYLGKEEDGHCTYLTPGLRCGIHEQEGYQAKPWTCRDFPFQAMPTPDGVYVGLSFACTAVVQSYGRPLEAHRQELEERFDCSELEPVIPLSGGARAAFAFDWKLDSDTPLQWADYRLIEAHLGEMLRHNHDLGLLLGAVQLVRAVRAKDLALLSEPARPGPGLGQAADGLLRGLLTLIETVGDPPEKIQEVLLAFHNNSTYPSRCLGQEIDLAALPPDLPPAYAEQSLRYLQHVIFRKWLLGAPDLLSRVCSLPLVAHALRFFTQGMAMVRGRSPQNQDFEDAVGLLEGKLMFHARGMDSYFGRIGRVFLQEA